jgi:hypothetical protein
MIERYDICAISEISFFGSHFGMSAPKAEVVDLELDAEFDRAFTMLKELVDLTQADQLCPVRGNSVYTTSVVLWMLVYQRMSPDSSLEAAVKKLVKSQPSLLSKNKRVMEKTLSTDTGGYSKARSRMPQAAARWFAEQVSQSLIDVSPPTFEQQRVFTLDGTTITLAPEDALQSAFPPASNQYGEGVWPVALLVVAHELASGAAMLPEVGAMYGPDAVSETSLIAKSLAAMPPGSLVMADAGFGIFAVANEISIAGHAFVLRMTKQRFASLRKKAVLIDNGARHNTWSHTWQPTAKERKTHPSLAADASLNVRLHEIVINEHLTLYLVANQAFGAEAFAALYERRGDVEIDIRNLKVILNTEGIRARSVDMFYKELYASIVSYNLVTQFRRQAAALINQPPRRMSFKRTWTTFREFLLSQIHTEPKNWRDQYRIALEYATKDRLPNRPGRRYEREAYPKRPKSNQFKKRKRKIPVTEELI